MKFSITSYNAVATWKWGTSSEPHKLYHYATSGADDDDDDEDDDVCGICRLAYESTCPDCKVPGDDCPLIWGECTHVFHMHCLLKWIDTESSKQQCPMDRRPWATADRKPDQLPTTVDGAPVAHLDPGPLPAASGEGEEEGERQEDAAEDEGGEAMEVDEGG
ncbi:anaphase-promoting complex subunit 11, partial [Tremellales sp. Uapishka_1]